MVVESQNQQPSVNVYPNGNGGNYGGGFGDMFGAGGGGAWFFWIILFFFMMMFMGGWNNNGNNGNNGTVQFVPYGAPYMMGGFGGNGGNCNCDSAAQAVRNGFDQSAVINGINGIQTQMQAGFNNAEVSRCNQQANILATMNNNQANILSTMNNNQNAMNAGFNSLNMGLQNCCCENRAATADLKYTVATEACADRAAVGDAFQALSAQNAQNMNAMMTQFNAGVQSIKDMMCADKYDNMVNQKNDRIAELERQLTLANLAASQTGQTSAIQAGQRALANEIEQYVNPTPVPAYIVQNPSCCNQNYSQCGCRQCA